MSASHSQTPDVSAQADELPPPYTFGIGERVAGPGVNGEIVDRPGPYSVTVIQNGVRLSASVVGLRKA